jgi:crotonobetainyl-CoA:carnitine CoA-transferase CaiB-like acyl-CoA transferase
LNKILANAFVEKNTEEWLEELEKKGVLCARINNFEEAARDPQIAHNNMIVSMESPTIGELKLLGNPIRLKGTPSRMKSFPPDLGEHNRDVARETGYSEAEIEEFIKKGVLV